MTDPTGAAPADTRKPDTEKPDTQKPETGKPTNGDGGGAALITALGAWKVFVLAVIVLLFMIALTAFLAWKAFAMSGTGDAKWAPGHRCV